MTLRRKLYKAVCFLILPVLFPLLLSGCIGESLDGCPLDILLQFTYKPDGAPADLFRDRVQRVTLCVYRPDGSIEHTRTLEKSELDRLQGVEMSLPQGTYTVVLWANASDAHARLGGFIAGQTMNELFVSHPQSERSSSIPTLDRLLFAAGRLTVGEHNAKTTAINFSPATMRVGLLLEGVSVQPAVRITNMASALKPVHDESVSAWNLHSVVQGKMFYPEVTYDAAAKRAEGFSDMPRFMEDTSGMVEIIDPNTGAYIVPPISLADLIRRYHIPIRAANEVTIPIQITFGPGYTRITVKNWQSQSVTPGV